MRGSSRRYQPTAWTVCLCLALLVARAGIAKDAPLVAADLHDGPYVFHEDDGSTTVKWVTAGRAETKRFAAGAAIKLPQFEHLLGKAWKPTPPEVPPAIWKQPAKLLVVSDVEGNHDALLRFLRANGVVDRKGHWSFGDGHLVGLGDMVDRGTQVTETLWLFHRLTREATAAGGHVHFILGNHEAMVLGNDLRYVHKKYGGVTKVLGRSLPALLGADTELGRWLRTCNAVERIGPYLFVHAGIAPEVAGDALDIQALNERVRSVLGVPKAEIEDKLAKAAVWGLRGPLWYRGYFEAHARLYGPTTSEAQLDAILAAAKAKSIVVGHTVVPQITPMFGGRVLAVDLKWTKSDAMRALLITGDKLEMADIRGRLTTLLITSD